ncbi:MAG: AgmX/PglI C-terminal domain-containing protein [Bacteriovoracaceae bacterium]|nr:AgmX/PglI C-terminal domain-containing protein [Bacteriovoracaceae bacterium]
MKKTLLFAIFILLAGCSSTKVQTKKTPKILALGENEREIHYAIQNNIQHFVSCYKRENSDARHFVKMNFVVDPLGNVAASKVKSNTANKRLEECVKSILDNITFDNPNKQNFKATKSLTFIPSKPNQG